jgi:hypothetical protein
MGARSLTCRPRTERRSGRKEAAVARRKHTRGASPKTRQELYDEARRKNAPGRSTMGRAKRARCLGYE